MTPLPAWRSRCCVSAHGAVMCLLWVRWQPTNLLPGRRLPCDGRAFCEPPRQVRRCQGLHVQIFQNPRLQSGHLWTRLLHQPEACGYDEPCALGGVRRGANLDQLSREQETWPTIRGRRLQGPHLAHDKH